MRWVRSNIRLGSWCALLALAIQFVLSFGHVHRAEFPWVSGHANLSALTASAVSVTGSDASAAAKPIGLASDYCAICAVMVLANSVRPAAAPSSPLPAGNIGVRFWMQAEVFSATSPHRLFQARAPPLA
jgi:predicted membrane metal-binding protein